MPFICFNGKFLPASHPVFVYNNRGYRYGDGFFETMRAAKGKIPLQDFHIHRIKVSQQLLGYLPTEKPLDNIFSETTELGALNNCGQAARIRLSFFNGNGNLIDENSNLDYLIEATPLQAERKNFNTNGLKIGVCPSIKKGMDPYANLKSANYLPSKIAADYAKKNHWDDAIIINQKGRMAETTIANLFWVKNNRVFTPPLSEGCVQGVMRSYLNNALKNNAEPVVERNCEEEQLLDADEIFVTNAATGIRWVSGFGHRIYACDISKKIYDEFVSALWME